jgi:hypothetical protein
MRCNVTDASIPLIAKDLICTQNNNASIDLAPILATKQSRDFAPDRQRRRRPRKSPFQCDTADHDFNELRYAD